MCQYQLHSYEHLFFMSCPQNPPTPAQATHNGRAYSLTHSPPYKLSCSSSSMSIISHSNTLLPTNPQLMPGISLSVCICLNCLLRSMAALDCPPGVLLLRPGGDAMMARNYVRLCDRRRTRARTNARLWEDGLGCVQENKVRVVSTEVDIVGQAQARQ